MKFLLFSAFTFISIHCLGQNQAEVQKETSDKIVNATFSIPAIPALELISSDPEEISRPGTTRELAASLYNSIDENGRVKQGIALESKFSELVGYTISMQDYLNNYWEYLAYNAQVSLGSVATSGDSSSTDLGWGLRVTLFDNSDPMKSNDFRQQVSVSFLDCLSSPSNPRTQLEIETCLADSMNNLKEEFTKNNWNSSWMSIAYAGGSRLKGSELKKGTQSSLGHQLWLSGGLKLSTWGHLGYLVKWSSTSRVEINESLQEFEVGGKLLLGKPTYSIYAETSYIPLLNSSVFETEPLVDEENVFSWSIGVEFRIADGLWVTSGLGEEAEKLAGSKGVQLIAGLRAGIADKARLQ